MALARPPKASVLLLLLAAALLLSSCGRNMYDQPKAELYETMPYDNSQPSVLPLPAGTVSRQRGAYAPAFYSGQDANGPLRELPLELTVDLVQRGQERYNIYCAVCHNFNGNGNGMIVQKGFPQPASFHEQRLLDAPVGYFYNAITNGFGRMYSYASRIPPEDRWAITAYIKALQLSQNAFAEDLPPEVREELGLEPAAPATTSAATSGTATGEGR